VEAQRLKQKKEQQATPKKDTPTSPRALTSTASLATEHISKALVFRDENAVVNALKTVREANKETRTKNWVREKEEQLAFSFSSLLLSLVSEAVFVRKGVFSV
jgi:hypothetical protein